MIRVEKMITAQEIMELTGMSQGYAYKLIKELNDELKEKGYYIIRGRLNRKYFMERVFGQSEGDVNASL